MRLHTGWFYYLHFGNVQHKGMYFVPTAHNLQADANFSFVHCKRHVYVPAGSLWHFLYHVHWRRGELQ